MILQNVSGIASPGRILSIMGGSGSGKTSLLHAISRSMQSSRKIRLYGNLQVNGYEIKEGDDRSFQAFVQQEDLFYPQLTVRETLDFADNIRSDNTQPAKTKQETVDTRIGSVDSILQELNMVHTQNTRIGDKKTRGISGGEKKRLSIGQELLGAPKLIFLDEPTTGLDSFQAQKVMEFLKQLANAGHTVVCSIHQPRSAIYDLFDDILLLHQGQQVFFGEKNQALPFFQDLGYNCPEHYNPAEFLIDIISIDSSNSELEKETSARVQTFAQAYQENLQPKLLNNISRFSNQQGQKRNQKKLETKKMDKFIYEDVDENEQALVSKNSHDKDLSSKGQELQINKEVSKEVRLALRKGHKRGRNLIKQIKFLFLRNWKQSIRDKPTIISRLGVNLSNSFIFGLIYWQMKTTESAILDRLGFFQVAFVGQAMTSLVRTLQVFPTERVIVSREQLRSSYSILGYIISKFFADLPVSLFFPFIFSVLVYPAVGLQPKFLRFVNFLGISIMETLTASSLGLFVGSFAPTPEAAVGIGPAIMVLFIVFGGYFSNQQNVPYVFRWIPQISMIKQAFEGAAINELKDLEYTTLRGEKKKGQEILKTLSFNSDQIYQSLISQARIQLLFYLYSYEIIKARRPKFQEMLPLQVLDQA